MIDGRTLGLPLLDAKAAGAGDAAAVDAGDTWHGLMHRAAGHLARGVASLVGGAYGRRVCLVVGKGNNGGDGWAAAARLADLGAEPWVISTAPLDADLSDEATDFRARWLRRRGRTGAMADLGACLDWADVAVDCLLGTGFAGEPRGDVGDAVRALAAAGQHGLPVVACDVPSGVECDTGRAADLAVTADLTVTFGGMKRGLVLHPGAVHAGRVVIGGLGSRYRPTDVTWAALTAADALPPALPADVDKRQRGTVLAVAGSIGASGAATLCAGAALAGGAGLVTLATPSPVQPQTAPVIPSAMTRPLPADGPHVSASAVEDLQDVGDFDVVVAGPGLGHPPAVRQVVDHLRSTARRLVLDADALNVHRDDPLTLTDHTGELILTPHAGELARIGGGDDGADAWGNRTERVPRLAREYGATIVAKGPGTIVAAPDGRVWVTPVGGPELGVGGTGDVLSGLIAAMVARATDIPLAVARAVWWHGFAGFLAAQSGGLRDSTDLVDMLPIARSHLADVADVAPGFPFVHVGGAG